MPELTIFVPGPLPGYSLNSRSHWSKRAAVVEDARERCTAAVLEQAPQPMPRFVTVADVHYRVVLSDGRNLDTDNVPGYCKPYLDALVEMEILRDDGRRYVTSTTAEIDPEPGEPGVWICLTYEGEKEDSARPSHRKLKMNNARIIEGNPYA